MRSILLGIRATRVRSSLAVLNLIAALSVGVLIAPQVTDAGHTLGYVATIYGGSARGGDCSGMTGNVVCRNPWYGPDTGTYVRLIDFTGVGGIGTWVNDAASNWNNAPGPQWFSRDFGDSYTYLYGTTMGGAGAGYTYNYDIYGNYYYWNGYIGYTYSYVNIYSSPTQAVYAWAHELGHSLGLFEHNDPDGLTALMRQGSYAAGPGPTPIDLGPLPTCNTSINLLGVRCIFHWNAN
jgi:hypothetical protein